MTSIIKQAETSALGDLNKHIANPPAWLEKALSVPREQGKVEVEGCAINYFRWGDPSKPGIIMLHGFLAHSRCFAFIAPFLAADYHVVAMDLAGMGESGWRDEYTEDLRVKDLMGVCEELELFEHANKPTIIAHSFGGRVAAATMHAHADRFSGVIICDLMIIRPSILEANSDKFGPPGKRDPDRPHRIYPDYAAAKQRFVLSPPQKVEEPILFDFMAYHSLKQVEGGWQWKFDPGVFRVPKNVNRSWAQVGETVITAPGRKAIIYGEKSFLFIPDSVDYMNELAEQHGTEPVPMIGIPHARHHLMLDQPMAFITALKSVLSMWKPL